MSNTCYTSVQLHVNITCSSNMTPTDFYTNVDILTKYMQSCQLKSKKYSESKLQFYYFLFTDAQFPYIYEVYML